MSIEITNILVDVWFQRLDSVVAEKRILIIAEAYAYDRVSEALEQSVLSSAEIQALRKGAERWGYVLKNPWRAIDALKVNCLTSPARWADEANEAIDAAMEKQT